MNQTHKRMQIIPSYHQQPQGLEFDRPKKEANARRLGADHIVLSTDATQMATLKGESVA